MTTQTLRRRMLMSAATALLAACSGGNQPAPEASASASETAAPAEVASTAPAPSEAAPSPSASASPSAAASPSASASAKAPAPSPTPEKIAVAVTAAAPPPASWARCAVCHAAEKGAPAKIGPNLYGVFGHKMGQGSYAFSDALKSSGLTLDEATLDKWLENPRTLVPGNRMSFPGLKDAAKRAEIIAYLKQQR